MEELHPSEKYKPEFCDAVIDHMSSGKSLASFQARIYDEFRIRVTRKTFYNWQDRYPEFKKAVDTGKAKALIFFEELLLAGSSGVMPKELQDKKSKGINLSGVIFALKTRFHREYGEKQQVDHVSSDGSLQIQFVGPIKEDES